MHVDKTNFHMKGFALRLALKQRPKTTQKAPVHLIYQREGSPTNVGSQVQYCNILRRAVIYTITRSTGCLTMAKLYDPGTFGLSLEHFFSNSFFRLL